MSSWWSRVVRGSASAPHRSEPGVGQVVLAPRERVLARATLTEGGSLMATTHGIRQLTAAGETVLHRGWHEVDAGAWSPQSEHLSVTWVDRSTAVMWPLPGAERSTGDFLRTFQDRVQASVVIAAPVEVDGRHVGQAAVRKDLATGQLTPSVVYRRPPRRGDTETVAQAERVLTDLCERAGLR